MVYGGSFFAWHKELKPTMEAAYPPENACFAAISATDFDQMPGFSYGYFAPASPHNKQYKWVSLSKAGNMSKRARGPLVPPGTLVYVAKPSSADTFARDVMPIGIATDGIQTPFTTASLQVSGVGCVRTGALFLTNINNSPFSETASSEPDNTILLNRIANTFACRAFEQNTAKDIQNRVGFWGPIIPSAGEIPRKLHNAHRSWARTSIEAMRSWNAESPSIPPFERDAKGAFEVSGAPESVTVDSSQVDTVNAKWANTEN